MVKQFGKGRVFVVGGNGVSNCRESPLITGITDAAHVHSPTGGQVSTFSCLPITHHLNGRL